MRRFYEFFAGGGMARFWTARVQDVLAVEPMRLTLDPSLSVSHAIRDLLAQAVVRQQGVVRGPVAGALLQHLVGARIACAIHPAPVEHHRYSTAVAQAPRRGDFEVGGTVVHVTTAPNEAVIARCLTNLNEGLRPVLITVSSQLPVALGLADNARIEDRIDIFDIEHFVAIDIYRRGRFESACRRHAVERLISEYNRIVDEVEGDPRLKIALG